MRDNWWRGAGIFLLTTILFSVVSGGIKLLFQFIPYIGDYLHLLSLGKDFYGIFSANNTPDNTWRWEAIAIPQQFAFTKTS